MITETITATKSWEHRLTKKDIISLLEMAILSPHGMVRMEVEESADTRMISFAVDTDWHHGPCDEEEDILCPTA